MKQLRQCFFVQVGADDAQPAGIVGAAVPQVDLAGYVVKLEPAARGVLQDTLGPQHFAVLLLIGEPGQDGADLVLLIPLRGLQADVAEHFVGVVAVAVVMVMMVVVMVMAAAGAVLAVFMMVVMMFMFIIVVIVIIVVVMVMMLMLVIVIVIIMMVVGTSDFCIWVSHT